LHKLPKDIFSSLVDIRAACVLFKELGQWDLSGDITSAQGKASVAERNG
jgi:hypothetical protein